MPERRGRLGDYQPTSVSALRVFLAMGSSSCEFRLLRTAIANYGARTANLPGHAWTSSHERLGPRLAMSGLMAGAMLPIPLTV